MVNSLYFLVGICWMKMIHNTTTEHKLYMRFDCGFTDWKAIIDLKDLNIDINDFEKYMEELGVEVVKK